MAEPERTEISGSPSQTCPECGASLAGDKTCQDEFYQALFWEDQYPELGAVHHLLVLGYHLQHPSLYSPAGLSYGLALLVDFVEIGLTPGEARRRSQARVGSDQRDWKITGTPDSHGEYPHPVAWTVRISDVIAGGPQAYVENVQAWARSILADLRAAHILPAGGSPGTA